MTGHPRFADLVDRAGDPDVVAHVSDCPSCRARVRLVADLPEVDADSLPGIEVARRRLADARQVGSRTLSMSPGSDAVGEPDDLEPGRHLGRYVVEALAGRGGMGAVYRVRHAQLGSVHALKILHGVTRAERARLMREGQAQGRLHHPNVVTVTDIIDVDGAPGLILEFVDGPSLRERLQQGPVPLPEADRVGTQILRGVAAAHAAGVIHRDLKPANVLLVPTEDGNTAKVADFGLARRLDDDPELTRSNTPLGTPAYMAPEQIRDASRADSRSDVFSLGAVLYELVTGRRAFGGLDVAEVFDHVRAGRYAPIDDAVPLRMRAAIARALAVDPAARFADGRAFLDAWRGDAPVVRPRRRRWGALAAGAVAAVALGLGGWWALTPADPAPAEPVERRLTALPDDIQVFDSTLSPDGAVLVYTDGRGVWRQAVEGGTEERVLAGGPYHSVDFFPDGQRMLVSGWANGEAGSWAVPLAGGAPELLARRTGRFARLSPNGDLLLFAGDDAIRVQSLAGGGEPIKVRTLGPDESVTAAAWSPRSDAFAAVLMSSDGGGWIEIVSADGRSSRKLVVDRGIVMLSLAAVEWVEPDTLLWASRAADEEGHVVLRALDRVSDRTDATAAREVHAWDGFSVTRLRGRDGRYVVARVESHSHVGILDLTAQGPVRSLSRDDWDEVAVGLHGGDVLAMSWRGGGGLYRQGLHDERPVRILSGIETKRIDAVGDTLLYLRWDTKASPAVVYAERRVGDEATAFLTLPLATDAVGAKRPAYAMRCRSMRCLLVEAGDDGFEFSWVDAQTGERGDLVLTLDASTYMPAWDLSPDETRVAAMTAQRLVVAELRTGHRFEQRVSIEFPQALAFSADGAELFASGLTESLDAPYRVIAVRPGEEPRTLWSSQTEDVNALFPSADGGALVLGVHAFDDDLWLLEGV